MDAPKLKLAIGTWTPERIMRAAAIMLLIFHVLPFFFIPLAPAEMKQFFNLTMAVPFQLPLLVLYWFIFFQRIPARYALLIEAFDSGLIVWLFGVRWGQLDYYWRLVTFDGPPVLVHHLLIFAFLILAVGILGLSLFGFLRLPRHERW